MGRQNIFIVPSKFRDDPFLLMPKNRKQLRYFIYLCKGRPWKSGKSLNAESGCGRCREKNPGVTGKMCADTSKKQLITNTMKSYYFCITLFCWLFVACSQPQIEITFRGFSNDTVIICHCPIEKLLNPWGATMI